MEVEDILKLHTHPLLNLDQSCFSLSTAQIKNLQDKFKKGVPFAYLTHHSEFYGHHFYINEHVLIPRQETELLVDLLVQEKRVFQNAVDVGTGSGVIILSLLAQKTVKKGTGVDISAEALEVARLNARRLKQDCDFFLSDRLQAVKEKFDLIVSNPPYIKQDSHKKLVHGKVDEFEPSGALYLADADYEKWFAIFFEQIRNHLLPGGVFMMEGHELELHHQQQTLSQMGFQGVKVINDYAGMPRFLRFTTAP